MDGRIRIRICLYLLVVLEFRSVWLDYFVGSSWGGLGLGFELGFIVR